jgi:hypothetical protein
VGGCVREVRYVCEICAVNKRSWRSASLVVRWVEGGGTLCLRFLFLLRVGRWREWSGELCLCFAGFGGVCRLLRGIHSSVLCRCGASCLGTLE